jgi:hypothetical protein
MLDALPIMIIVMTLSKQYKHEAAQYAAPAGLTQSHSHGTIALCEADGHTHYRC